MTNTKAQLNKITELNSKRKYSLSTQAKKMIFYMKSKIRLSSLTATLYARKVTYLRLEDRNINQRFHTQLNFKYEDITVLSTWKKGVRIYLLENKPRISKMTNIRTDREQ